VPSTPPAEVTPDTPPTAGITISGEIRQTQGALTENDVTVEGSAVAAERGVVGVRIDDPGEGVVFRFEDTGDGMVRGTRYEIRDGEEVATESQTLAIHGAGDGYLQPGGAGTLSFDRLGLQVALDERYTAGDLQFVEIASGPSTEGQVAAGTLAGGAAPSPDAGATETREQELARLTALEQQLLTDLAVEERSLIEMLDQVVAMGDPPVLSGLMGEGREALLRELAETLVAQDSLTTDRVLQLLS
jgi:hypothetical protein